MRCPSFEESMSSIVGNLKNDLPGDSPTGVVPCAVGFYFAFRTMAVLVFSTHFWCRTADRNRNKHRGRLCPFAYDCILLGWATLAIHSDKSAKLPGVRWALLFLGFSCCSLLWSGTASLTNSIAYWCAMAADFLIVAMLLRTGPLTEVCGSLMSGFIWGACTVALVAWLMPAQSDLRLGDEELLGPESNWICLRIRFLLGAISDAKEEGELGCAGSPACNNAASYSQ